jgi:hypothetical protein
MFASDYIENMKQSHIYLAAEWVSEQLKDKEGVVCSYCNKEVLKYECRYRIKEGKLDIQCGECIRGGDA